MSNLVEVMKQIRPKTVIKVTGNNQSGLITLPRITKVVTHDVPNFEKLRQNEYRTTRN